MKRFSYLKPIKTKGLFYNSKNTGGMRARAKATNTLVYVILGFICFQQNRPTTQSN